MRTAWNALLLVGLAVLGAFFLKYGVEGALASSGIAGEPGTVLITRCFHSRGVPTGCSGDFTPADRPVVAAEVVDTPGDYPPGTVVDDVRLLDGQAWPAGWGGAPYVFLMAVFGGGMVAIVIYGLVRFGEAVLRGMSGATATAEPLPLGPYAAKRRARPSRRRRRPHRERHARR